MVPKARPRVVKDTVNQTRKANGLKRPGFRVAPWEPRSRLGPISLITRHCVPVIRRDSPVTPGVRPLFCIEVFEANLVAIRSRLATIQPTMTQNPFQKSWIYFVTLIVCSVLIPSLACWPLTEIVIELPRQGLGSFGVWNCLLIVGIDLALIALFIAMLWKIYCDWNTILNEQGVLQPSLFRKRSIHWSGVTGLTLAEDGLHVHGSSDSIVISLAGYRYPTQVINEIRARVTGFKAVTNGF
jgi:hypothetical protein